MAKVNCCKYISNRKLIRLKKLTEKEGARQKSRSEELLRREDHSVGLHHQVR